MIKNGQRVEEKENYWERLETDVIPSNAPDIQRQEMQKAYYAGAQAVRVIMDHIALDSFSEDAAVQVLEGLDCELEAFFNPPVIDKTRDK